MKAITIKCPKCKEVSDLYLGSEAFMIILNCPSCSAPLIYYYGRTTEITEEELGRIEKSGVLRNAGSLLKEISKCGIKLQTPKAVRPYSFGEKPPRKKPRKGRKSRSAHAKGQPVRAEYISKDDVVNLRIELETCRSVEEFLSMI